MVATVFGNRVSDKIGSDVMDAALAESACQRVAGFRLVFIDSQGLRHQERLATGWAVSFEPATGCRRAGRYLTGAVIPGDDRLAALRR